MEEGASPHADRHSEARVRAEVPLPWGRECAVSPSEPREAKVTLGIIYCGDEVTSAS